LQAPEQPAFPLVLGRTNRTSTANRKTICHCCKRRTSSFCLGSRLPIALQNGVLPGHPRVELAAHSTTSHLSHSAKVVAKEQSNNTQTLAEQYSQKERALPKCGPQR
jgi:hypothetical protein